MTGLSIMSITLQSPYSHNSKTTCYLPSGACRNILYLKLLKCKLSRQTIVGLSPLQLASMLTWRAFQLLFFIRFLYFVDLKRLPFHASSFIPVIICRNTHISNIDCVCCCYVIISYKMLSWLLKELL